MLAIARCCDNLLETHASFSRARTVRITSFGGCSSGSLAADLAALELDSARPSACVERCAPRRFILGPARVQT